MPVEVGPLVLSFENPPLRLFGVYSLLPYPEKIVVLGTLPFNLEVRDVSVPPTLFLFFFFLTFVILNSPRGGLYTLRIHSVFFSTPGFIAKSRLLFLIPSSCAVFSLRDPFPSMGFCPPFRSTKRPKLEYIHVLVDMLCSVFYVVFLPVQPPPL